MLARIWVALLLIATPLSAQEVESVYTSLDMDADCAWDTDGHDGGWAECFGIGTDYPVFLVEGDLRMGAMFGHVEDAEWFIDGFLPFNYVGDTVEWRIEDEKPYATILRWFITYLDEDGMNIEGQTLVISTVAQPDTPADQRKSCHVAYVDALSNPNANQLARQVAHLAAKTFRCGVDIPIYVGEVGKLAGGQSQWHPAQFE